MPSSGISSGSLSQIYWYETFIFYVFTLRIVHVLLPSYSFEQYEGKRRAHASCGLTSNRFTLRPWGSSGPTFPPCLSPKKRPPSVPVL